MTQEDIAELLKFHSNTVGHFERGEHFCKPKTLEKLAKILGIKPSDLFETNSKRFETNNSDTVYKIGKMLGSLSSAELDKVYNFVLSIKN